MENSGDKQVEGDSQQVNVDVSESLVVPPTPGVNESQPLTQVPRALQDLNVPSPNLVLVGSPRRENVPAAATGEDDSDEENRPFLPRDDAAAEVNVPEGQGDEAGGEDHEEDPPGRRARLPRTTGEYVENHGRRT